METTEKLDLLRKEVIEDFSDGFMVMRDTVEAIEVITEKDCEKAGDLNKQIKNAIKKLDEKRKEEKKPFSDLAKEVDNIYNEYIDKLKPLKDNLDAKLAKALRVIEDEKRARAEAAKAAEQERMRQHADQMAEAAIATDDDAALEIAENIEKERIARAEKDVNVKGRARGSVSTTSLSFTWQHEITDPDAVPSFLCSPDDKKIKDYIKANKHNFEKHKLDEITDMKGIRIYKKYGVSSR